MRRSLEPDSFDITPDEYERQVVSWLAAAGGTLKSFRILHQAPLEGAGGSYTFDALVEFEALEGAEFKVLVECKRHLRRVERADVVLLHGKLRDVGAHKAMIFSTAGFQSGAIEYAYHHGIATVKFFRGELAYETRGAGASSSRIHPSIAARLPRYSGWILSLTESGSQRGVAVDDHYSEGLRAWLADV